MGRFFSIDSGFFRVMGKVADFIILDVITLVFCAPALIAYIFNFSLGLPLFILCCVLSIGIGPALAAMFYVALKEVTDQEGYLLRSYWKGFKDNFIHGVLAEIIFVVIALVLMFDMEVCYQWGTEQGSIVGKLLYFVLLGFLIMTATAIMYAFPLMAKFENTVIRTVKNSYMMAVKHLIQTLMMALITYGLLFYSLTYPFLLLFTLGIIAYADSYVFVRIFKIYIPKHAQQDDELESKEALDNPQEEQHIILTADDINNKNE